MEAAGQLLALMLAVLCADAKADSSQEDGPALLGLSPTYVYKWAHRATLTLHGLGFPVDGGRSRVMVGDRLSPELNVSSPEEIVAVIPYLWNISAIPGRNLTFAEMDDLVEMTLGHPQVVTVDFLDVGLTLRSPVDFAYVDKPSIDSIHPTDTISQGGTSVTVTGEHLLSPFRREHFTIDVFDAQWLELEYLGSVSTKCHITNNTEMLCTVPDVGSVIGINDTDDSPFWNYEFYVCVTEVSAEECEQAARARPCCGGLRGPPGPTGTGGGNTGATWQPSGVLPPPSLTPSGLSFQVYAGPRFARFEDGTRMYDPDDQERLTIRGKYLRHGIRAGDYTINIGADLCRDIQLFDNLINCLPPNYRPQLHPEQDQDKPPRVMVTIRRRYLLGYFDYPAALSPDHGTPAGGGPKNGGPVAVNELELVNITSLLLNDSLAVNGSEAAGESAAAGRRPVPLLPLLLILPFLLLLPTVVTCPKGPS